MSQNDGYLDIIAEFSKKTIMVAGDLILDVYLKGRSTRLCPEAPVPVVDVVERAVALGGAANTACNLRALGATVLFCTVIGTDTEGDEAISMLESAGIDTQYIIRRDDRKTITKSRIVSGTQVITRVDQGSEDATDHETAAMMGGLIEESYSRCDAIVISDYDKGVMTKPVVERLIKLQSKKMQKFVAVDSKRLPFYSLLRPACAKPNYQEVLNVLALPPVKNRIQQIGEHAMELYQAIDAPLILATLDEDGTVIIEYGSVTHHVPASPAMRPSVSGAGDTYLSAFVLSWLSSANTVASAEIANAAAAIAIAKDCTATCTTGELRTHFNVGNKYIADITDLGRICRHYHDLGKKVVFTNGCFDILHSGHVTYLHRARQMGDVLIVGLNSDESIRRIKGDSRPINAIGDRIHVLAGLSSVDHIVPFGDPLDDTPIPLIKVVRPHIFVKGGDYTKDSLPEADTVENFGGKIVLIDHVPDRSTTRIISRIKSLTPDLDSALSGFPS